ncbi:uncharacterized protein LOC118179341 [Stegodyphus dumicola]|uniref:uncharacterized protein LOC118179341 n=1 Tax=Stegodyphus dumicola TaxID=202533 RepID=UPI0015AAFB13|nr:uncharacterized protein LOC118179341 [Stegodyphus dumicola]
MLNETHLRCTHKLKIPNYDIYRADRLHNGGGGTAIAIKSSLKSYAYPLPAFNSIEACACILPCSNCNYLIVYVYKPPQSHLNTQDLDAIVNLGLPTLIAGDFNCKNTIWNSRTNNSDGITLYNYCQFKDMNIHAPDDPTFISSAYGCKDTLDILITANINQQPYLFTDNVLSSDHFPVRFTLYGLSYGLPPVNSKINWEDFSYIMQENTVINRNLNSPQDIEDTIDKFTPIACTKHSINLNRTIHPEKFTLPVYILNKIKEKNRLRKIYHRTLDPIDKRNFNQANRTVKKLIKEYKDDSWNIFINSLSHISYSVCKIAKAITRNKDEIKPINYNNKVLINPKDIANAFAKSYENQFTVNHFLTLMIRQSLIT